MERPEQLLAETRWLRRVAIDIVDDEHVADDVAQDTLLRSLQTSQVRERRAWLKRVARNLAISRHRHAERRSRREKSRARSAELPATDDVVARVEEHRRVVDVVMALPAHYREVVLLRYFDDLPPRTIATRLSLSVETVRTRIKRGLAQLRTGLDREYGSRRSWLAALTPLVHPRKQAVAAATGTIGWIMTSKQFGIAAAALVAIGAAWVWHSPRVEDVITEEPTAMTLPAAGRTPIERPQRRDNTPRSKLAIAPRRHGWYVSGRVQAAGIGIAGAEVRAYLHFGTREEVARVRSGSDGRYELSLSQCRRLSALQRQTAFFMVSATADGYLPTEGRGRIGLPTDDRENWSHREILQFERGGSLRGRLLTGDGNPVPNVSVYLYSSDDMTPQDNAATDADGEFVLGIRKRGRYRVATRRSSLGAALSEPFDHPGHTSERTPDIYFAPGERLRGRIVYPDGSPIGDLAITVRWKSRTGSAALQPPDFERFFPRRSTSAGTRTDAEGRFDVRGLPPGRYEVKLLGIDLDLAKHELSTDATQHELETWTDRRIIVDAYRVRFRPHGADNGPLHGSDIAARAWPPARADVAQLRFDGLVPLGEEEHEQTTSLAGRVEGPNAEMSLWLDSGGFVIARAAAHGYVDAIAAVRVTRREHIVPLALRRPGPGGCVRVRVIGENGTPIRAFRATLAHPNWNTSCSPLDLDAEPTDPTLGPVAPGRYRLHVSPGRGRFRMTDYFEIRKDVVVRAGAVDDVVVRAKRGGRLRFTLRTPNRGSSVPSNDPACRIRAILPSGKTISLAPYVRKTRSGWSVSTRVPNGHPFTAKKLLAPGRYNLKLQYPDYAEWHGVADVRAARVTDVDITLVAK